MYPVLGTLTQRQLELIHLKGIRQLPDHEFRVLDLSQNLNFAQVSSNKIPCVTPDGQKFLTQRVRFLTGVESLRLMGIYVDERKLQRRFSSSLVQDLAGNAYETSSCAANMVCNMVFLAHNFVCQKSSSEVLATVGEVAPKHQDDDDNGNSDVDALFFDLRK